MNAKNQKMTGFEVAVIGMAGRFPGSENIDEFWQNLKNGVESILFFTDEELFEAGVEPQLLDDPNFVRTNGGLIENKYCFDASFFDYSPREAQIMDPQLRILHECAWHALEHAGYAPLSFDGAIGFYTGARPNFDWEALAVLSGGTSVLGAFASEQLIQRDYFNTRIAYKLNLKGPALLLQTACSTSLVAIHMASRALLMGECKIALAGGVSFSYTEKRGYRFIEGMIGASDGHCRAFDAEATGTIGGEGVGIVALKRLKHALADGDTIHAVIKGTGVNNDGVRKVGFTAPSIQAQSELVRNVLHMSKVEPESITYIEAHGTGTPLGDPIEVEALTRAFDTEERQYCALGSVKTNIGHLDAAAGVAGVIKTVLALKNKQIPPSLNFETPNPNIDFEHSPFYVASTLKQWHNPDYPLRAAVNSLGIGGTNAHVILEEWLDTHDAGVGDSTPRTPESPNIENNTTYQLIVLSAKTESALERQTDNFLKYLEENPRINLPDTAYTLQVGRDAFKHRKIWTVNSSNPDFSNPWTAVANEDNRVVFMFPGQGNQYVNMGLDLYRNFPLFKETMDHCFQVLKPILGYDIKEILYPGNKEKEESHHSPDGAEKSRSSAAANKINRTEMAQPLLFMIEYALAKLLMKWGIKPDAMIGHSIGEYAAACLAGVFSLEDALKIVALRGKMMQSMPAGAMLSVVLPHEQLKPVLVQHPKVTLAAVNAPSLCVVSGTFDTIDRLETELKTKEIQCRRLQTSHAFHSYMMDPILKQFEDAVNAVPLHSPRLPFISNLTGKWIAPQEAASPAYWANHLRQAVLFADGIANVREEKESIYIEVGPGRSLSTFAKKQFSNINDQINGQQVVNLVKHPKENNPDDEYLLSKIGQLWLHGVKIDWPEFWVQQERKRIPLPNYPFEKNLYRLEIDSLAEMRAALETDALLTKKQTLDNWFYTPGWKRTGGAPPPIEESSDPLNWLIFIDEQGIGLQLVEALEQEKRNHIDVVRRGTRFAFNGGSGYTLNPRQNDDYHALIRQLKQQDHIPHRIIHLWNLSAGHRNNDAASGLQWQEAAEDNGFYSLVYLSQAMGKENIDREIFLTAVMNNTFEVTGADAMSPLQALVLGPAMVIPREHPNIQCRCIDIYFPEPGTSQEKKLVLQLANECRAVPDVNANIIAYRNGFRWVRTFESVHLPAPRRESTELPLKKGGVYLITGGLGGIGLTFARHLAHTVAAFLILVSRSAFPKPHEWDRWLDTHEPGDSTGIKILKLRELEKAGSHVQIVQANVSDFRKMQSIIGEIKNRLGSIDGVIHAAGAPGDGMIQLKTREKADNVLAPKVKGTLVLNEILHDHPLDFFILCSSMNSILPVFGQVDYYAANAFLDAFAQYKASKGGTRVASVNWDTWQEVGMAVEAAKKFHSSVRHKKHDDDTSGAEFEAEFLKDGIKPAEGIEVLNRVLSGSLAQVAVSTIDLSARIKSNNKAPSVITADAGGNENKSLLPMNKRPELNTQFVAPQNELEHKIAAVWQDMLGIEPIGILDSFFELGGDSLSAVQVVYRLKEVKIDISVDDIFLHQNIQNMCRDILKENGPGGSSSDENEQSLLHSEGDSDKKVPLKETISEAEQKEIVAGIEKNNTLTRLLSENNIKKRFPISSNQEAFLLNPEYIAQKNILFHFMFKHPADEFRIKEILLQIIAESSMLRSVIEVRDEKLNITEYDSFANIDIPFIDISHFSDNTKKKIMDDVNRRFQLDPFNVIGHLLHRLVVFKWDNSSFQLIFSFNHLIFDGESSLILEEKIRNQLDRSKNISEPGALKDYYDYIEFLNQHDYKEIDLNDVFSTSQFNRYKQEYIDRFSDAETLPIIIEADISSMNEPLKNLYNEVMLLCFARMLSRLFRLDKVPLTFVSKGRQYRNGNFSKVIGDFHDGIPVLFSFNSKPNYNEIIEQFIDYREYVKEKNLCFTNYYHKKIAAGNQSAVFKSPLIFNSHIGVYEAAKKLSTEIMKNAIIGSDPLFNFEMTKDFYSDKLLIYIAQNFSFDEKQLTLAFNEAYEEIVRDLNQSNVFEKIGQKQHR